MTEKLDNWKEESIKQARYYKGEIPSSEKEIGGNYGTRG